MTNALIEGELEYVTNMTVSDDVALVDDKGADTVAEDELLPLTVAVTFACIVVVAITDAVELMDEEDVSVVKDDCDPVRDAEFETIDETDAWALFDGDGVTEEEALALGETEGLLEIFGEALEVVVEVVEIVLRDDGDAVIL